MANPIVAFRLDKEAYALVRKILPAGMDLSSFARQALLSVAAANFKEMVDGLLAPTTASRQRGIMTIHHPRHPFAWPNCSAANGMKAGDRVQSVIDGRTGIADEFTHDGDTYMAWDDGTFGMHKWRSLVPMNDPACSSTTEGIA